jgi:hypothetical protein
MLPKKDNLIANILFRCQSNQSIYGQHYVFKIPKRAKVHTQLIYLTKTELVTNFDL